jgi:hypothetical protein
MIETIQRGGRPVAGFGVGAVLGVYSVDDLDKLIKNKDVEMSAMGQQVAQSTDPSIKRDWDALSKAYQAARVDGVKAVADGRSSIVPTSIASNPDVRAAYQAILVALQPVPDKVTPGSKQDIGNRLIAAGWKPSYTLPYQIQSDADLSFYRATDPSNLPNPVDFLAWLKEHKTAILVSVSVVGGVIVLGVLSPYARLLSTALPRR